MKFRSVFIFFLIVSTISACNFSMAEDITPPPGYVSPTPPPDLGPLFPEVPPSPARGAEFFAVSCAPCHGDKGLGNGPMAPNMPVAVPAIGLRDISSQNAPADWYSVTSLGNLESGMPPFMNHPTQELWDILAYTYTLTTTPEELQRGADLYTANCSSCHGEDGSANPEFNISDQELMSQVTGINLYRGIAEGKGLMKPFSGVLTEDDIWAVAAYVRALTYDLSVVEPTPTVTPEPSQTPDEGITGTPDGTETAQTEVVETPGPITASIAGSVMNASGTQLEEGLIATLVLYNSTGSEIADTQTSEITPAGTFAFNNIITDPEIAYWVSVDYQGVTYYSDFAAYDGTTVDFDLPIVVYDATTDWLSLQFDLVHISLDVSTDAIQVSELFVISNTSNKTVLLATDGTSLPFIKLPEGVTEFSSLSPDSRGASFLPAVGGVALAPTQDAQYGVVATFSIPYDRKFEFNQVIPMPVVSLSIFVPEGVKIKTDQLSDSGIQDFNGSAFHLYEATDFPAGDLTFTVSGTPGGNQSVVLNNRSWLIIGAGILGVIFLGLGIFLFLRDRSQAKKEENLDELMAESEEDPLGNDPNAIADAIIALDEQLMDGEISKEVHEKRVLELKARLKEIL